MKLTSDYRRIIAIFEARPQGEIQFVPKDQFGKTSVRFRVGPFRYDVILLPRDDTTYIFFELISIDSSDEQRLIQIISQVEGRDVSIEEARKIRGELTRRPKNQDLMGFGGQYSMKIFGNVLNILKDYVEKYQPRCLFFNGKDHRVDLYTKMMQRAFPDAEVMVESGSFKVCFRR